MFLDERFHIVAVHRVSGQEGLAGLHPGLGLLTVPVEQLQLQTLVQLHTPRNPRSVRRISHVSSITRVKQGTLVMPAIHAKAKKDR